MLQSWKVPALIYVKCDGIEIFLIGAPKKAKLPIICSSEFCGISNDLKWLQYENEYFSTSLRWDGTLKSRKIKCENA